ncbi:MAG: NTP transferase domain-containing protein [candidate division KSB1 bacterium]|nr:NTP transferase domain-containing protein [candidate division KSB1 bacterium]
MERELRAVILAAGRGTRMKSDLPKVLHHLRGRPMVEYVIQACRDVGVQTIYVVVGYGAEKVRQALGPNLCYVTQQPQLGTGHALQQVAPLLADYSGDLLVLVGDSPLVTAGLLRGLWQRHQSSGAAATFLTAVFDRPPAYGRVLRDQHGRVARVVEEADASPEIAAIKEVITSQYCFRAEIVLPLLHRIDNRNAKGEYYLTDIVGILRSEGHEVEAMQVQDTRLVWAVNTPQELAQAERFLAELQAEQAVAPEGVKESSR